MAESINQMDDADVWRSWLELGRRLHRYSFGNTMLILAQNPEATAVAGYRTWQALGHQVRAGEKAMKVLGPVHRRVRLLDETGQPVLDASGDPKYERQLVGWKPVPVFDASQVDPPVLEPPAPTLLEGEAPGGLWEALAVLVDQHGYTLTRGDCGGANGTTAYDRHEVRVRSDISDAQAVKTLAHELGHVLLPPPAGRSIADGQCRGLLEVEAESVAYMVTRAHGLDSSQYTFNYVGSWARHAAEADQTISDVIEATGARVIRAVDEILQHTQPEELQNRINKAYAEALDANGITVATTPQPAWETVKPDGVPAAERDPPVKLTQPLHPALGW